MPRQVRIEYAGAFYHVMARGDRREAIVKDDEDRKTFVRTLGEAAERAGFRIHAWVLMSNHYHLLVETPEANLSKGRPSRRGQPFIIDIDHDWAKQAHKLAAKKINIEWLTPPAFGPLLPSVVAEVNAQDISFC